MLLQVLDSITYRVRSYKCKRIVKFHPAIMILRITCANCASELLISSADAFGYR